MVRAAIQLYTVREVEQPLPELLEGVHEAGFEGVEFAGRVTDADADRVRETLDETGLEPVAAHVDIERLEADPDGTIEFYRSLGCEHLVVPWLGPEAFEAVEAIEATADRLQSVAETVADHGMTFSYHNHDHEFVRVEGETAFDRLAAATTDPVGFELDCGWVTVGGVDPVSLLDRLDDRVSLVHISDADETGSPTEVGEGVLDLTGCLEAATDHGIEWAVYEHDDPDDAMASASHGAEVLGRF
ncbi:sugar phosphate isomerase/epimerase family protein [Halococcus hamelinensis]|nr:sugar phosphate isomerase/epimerase [Halococcus hamelinensis]